MKIAYLGHAGFLVETDGALVICDPWLSPTGAFDSSWFQLPQNHHLGPVVDAALGNSAKEKFVYISHEHEDHYDRAFLESLQNRGFTLVLAKYRKPDFRRQLADYRCNGLLAVKEGQSIPIPGGSLTLYLDDSELNRDSAIVIRGDGQTFVNFNDCRIFDRVNEIAHAERTIDVFTCQFSGTSWHPTCYEYSTHDLERISRAKVLNKYSQVEKAIDALRPRYFMPSAGPVCFLDPELFSINDRMSGVFRPASELLCAIHPALDRSESQWRELLPGDSLNVSDGKIMEAEGERYVDERFASYVEAYAAKYVQHFRDRAREQSAVSAPDILSRLQTELEQKLSVLTLRERVEIPLYFGLNECRGTWLRVDFPRGTVEPVHEIAESAYYRIVGHAWQVEKVLNRSMTWENFALSFRVRVKRVPDVYQQLIHAFVTLERSDLYRFCQMILNIENNRERIEVVADGETYSVSRLCPHNGGDLQEGWVEDGRYLVCPRHRWRFDLVNGGICTNNVGCIVAERLEQPAEDATATAAAS